MHSSMEYLMLCVILLLCIAFVYMHLHAMMHLLYFFAIHLLHLYTFARNVLSLYFCNGLHYIHLHLILHLLYFCNVLHLNTSACYVCCTFVISLPSYLCMCLYP